jgi:uncharacterized protein involved in tolerance to divalent cations
VHALFFLRASVTGSAPLARRAVITAQYSTISLLLERQQSDYNGPDMFHPTDGRNSMEEYTIVFITTGNREEAEKIAMQLIESGSAPCINIVSPCTSIYQWKGKVHRTEEALMIVKSRRSQFDSLRELVERVHSYDVAEILAVPITGVSEKYASFLGGFFDKYIP